LFQNLGNTLVLIRNLRRKSQAQVAQETGIEKRQLSKYENGKELPGLDVLDRLLTVLDVSLHELFFTLALVDERAALLSSSGVSAQRSLLVVPRKGDSLLLPRTEDAFEKLQSIVLELYRRVYRELVFRRVPELERAGVAEERDGKDLKDRKE
jgi:transcriptional regulator with XRE-family HTH domain